MALEPYYNLQQEIGIELQSKVTIRWLGSRNFLNILCLYGDEVKGGDQPETKEVRDLDTTKPIKNSI